MAPVEVLLLPNVQEQEGPVADGGRSGLFTVEGFLSWGRWWEDSWIWGVDGSGDGGGLALAANGGGGVVVVEGAGGVPRILKRKNSLKSYKLVKFIKCWINPAVVAWR